MRNLQFFVVKEHNSRSLFSTVVPRKGVSESDVAVSFYQQCIAELGYSFTPIKVKNDQEPAIKAVIDKLLAVRPAQTIVQESPVGASASNGSIENAISCLEDQIRVDRLSLEHNFAHRVPIGHPIFTWLVRHSGFLHRRFQIGHDGMSAYQRIHHKPYDRALMAFGEIFIL